VHAWCEPDDEESSSCVTKWYDRTGMVVGMALANFG
jgi:hypothetical protein